MNDEQKQNLAMIIYDRLAIHFKADDNFVTIQNFMQSGSIPKELVGMNNEIQKDVLRIVHERAIAEYERRPYGEI